MRGDGDISVREEASNAVVVSPVGDIDMSCSPQLRNTLREVQSRRPARLIVDLDEVGYMDSSGVATLVEAMRSAKQSDTALILAGLNDRVRSIFEIARLTQFFRIAESVDSALAEG